MCAQIGFVYNANRLSSRPFGTVLHTSFGPTASPRLWKKMEKHGWDRWKRSRWWEQNVGDADKALKAGAAGSPTSRNDLPASEEVTIPESSAAAVTAAGERSETKSEGSQATGVDQVDPTTHLTGPTLPPSLDPTRHQIVYLSADAEDELEELSENEVYVIGGIVDRNRHKVCCRLSSPVYVPLSSPVILAIGLRVIRSSPLCGVWWQGCGVLTLSAV